MERVETRWSESKEPEPFPAFGKVVWNKNTNSIDLYVYRSSFYQIDLDRCKTKEDLLDWIFYLMGKTWANEIMFDLLRMFKLVLPNELLFN